MSLNRYKLSEASKHASRYKLQKGGVPKIATGVATMCVSPRENLNDSNSPNWSEQSKLQRHGHPKGGIFQIAKIQLPGNSAGDLFGMVTSRDPNSKANRDLQLHPGRLTWNLQIAHLEGKMIFQASMILFHVNLQGCSI